MKRSKMKKKFYVTRDANGRIRKWTSIKKSLKRDKLTDSKTVVASGYGHLGDQKKRKKKK